MLNHAVELRERDRRRAPPGSPNGDAPACGALALAVLRDFAYVRIAT